VVPGVIGGTAGAALLPSAAAPSGMRADGCCIVESSVVGRLSAGLPAAAKRRGPAAPVVPPSRAGTASPRDELGRSDATPVERRRARPRSAQP